MRLSHWHARVPAGNEKSRRHTSHRNKVKMNATLHSIKDYCARHRGSIAHRSSHAFFGFLAPYLLLDLVRFATAPKSSAPRTSLYLND